MRPLYYHELVFIGGGTNDLAELGGCGCEVCDAAAGYNQVELDTVEVKGSRLGTPDITLNNTPGWGALLGGMAGARVGGIAGSEIGAATGHFIENFDWEWYRNYREIAEPIEREYSGGLP